jgi:hypothetical protein
MGFLHLTDQVQVGDRANQMSNCSQLPLPETLTFEEGASEGGDLGSCPSSATPMLYGLVTNVKQWHRQHFQIKTQTPPVSTSLLLSLMDHRKNS